MADEIFEQRALSLSRVFTPATAINSEDLFYGRKEQVRAVVDAINQVGQHAILYGERGVGKTSLGRILATKIRGREPTPVTAPMVNCDSGDTFHSIWTKVFSELSEGIDKPDDDSGSYVKHETHSAVIMRGIQTGLVNERQLQKLVEREDRYPLFKKHS